MPRVTIVMSQGRTTDQKRKLVKAVTDAVSESLGLSKDVTTIAIHEIPEENFAKAGILSIDQKKTPR